MLTTRTHRTQTHSNRTLRNALLALGVASTLFAVPSVQAQRDSLPAGYRSSSSYRSSLAKPLGHPGRALGHQQQRRQSYGYGNGRGNGHGNGHGYGNDRDHGNGYGFRFDWSSNRSGWSLGHSSSRNSRYGQSDRGICNTQVITCRPLARCGLESCHTCHPLSHNQREVDFSFDRMLENGWAAIARCDFEEAREIFKYLNVRDDCDPRPLIGLAIARGSESWEGLSARTMRKAIDLDVKAIFEQPCSSQVRRHVISLLDHFEKQLRYGCREADDLFMVAALKTMLGDLRGADAALHEAIEVGDCSISARKLMKALHAKLRCVRAY